jgi:hypothetical protein
MDKEISALFLLRFSGETVIIGTGAFASTFEGERTWRSPGYPPAARSGASMHQIRQDAVLGDWRQENPIRSLIHVSVVGHARRILLVGLERRSRPL